jgi:hypothetical protein
MNKKTSTSKVLGWIMLAVGICLLVIPVIVLFALSDAVLPTNIPVEDILFGIIWAGPGLLIAGVFLIQREHDGESQSPDEPDEVEL